MSRLYLIPILSAAIVSAAPGQKIEFNRDIRPILSDRCFTCHGPDATHRQAGIRFDIPNAGPAPSEILRRIAATDADRMPPESSGKAKLTAHEVDLMRQCIEQGQP